MNDKWNTVRGQVYLSNKVMDALEYSLHKQLWEQLAGKIIEVVDRQAWDQTSSQWWSHINEQ